VSFQYKNVYWLWLSAAIIVLDQISKQLVVKHLAHFESRPLLPNFNLVHMKNTGAAFSMMSQMPPFVFVLLGTAVSIGILLWLRSNASGQRLIAIALSLILGGALGNVIDRATRGHVVDFVDFYVGNWHFAAFNVADIAISFGAAFLVLDMLLDLRRSKMGSAAEK